MNYRDEEDIFEEDIVFDQAGLLSSARKRGKSAIRRVSSGRCAMLSKTLALCGAFFGLGLSIALPGPASPMPPTDLDTENGGEEHIYRCLGFMLGAMLGGMLLDRFNRLFLVFLALLMCAILVAMVPWTGNVWLLRSDLILLGATMGFLLTGGNVLCLDLWGQNSGPFMQALHFSFSLGAFLAPLIASPLSPAVTTVPPITEHHRYPREINNTSFGFAEGVFVSPMQTQNLNAMSAVPLTNVVPINTTDNPLLSSQPVTESSSSNVKMSTTKTSTSQDVSLISSSTTTTAHSTHHTPKPKPEKNSGKNLDKASKWDSVHAGKPDPKDVLPISSTKTSTSAPSSSSSQAVANSRSSSIAEINNATTPNSSTTTTRLPIQEIFQNEPVTSKDHVTAEKINEKASANVSIKEEQIKAVKVSDPVPTELSQSGQEMSVKSTSTVVKSTSTFSISTPSTQKSSISTPSTQKSSISTSSTQRSSINTPSTQRSSINTPSTQTSSISTPSTQKSSISTPSTQTSSISTPSTQTSSITTSTSIPRPTAVAKLSSPKTSQSDLHISTTPSTLSTQKHPDPTKSTTLTASTKSSHSTSSSTTPAIVYSPEAPPKLLTLTEKKSSTSEPPVTPRTSTDASPPSTATTPLKAIKLPSSDKHVDVTSAPHPHRSKPTTYDNDTELVYSVMDQVADHFGKEYGLSRLQLSYLLVALLLFVVSLLFLGFLCFNPRDPRSRSEDDVGGGRSNVIRPRWIRITLTTLMMLLLALSAGVQFSYGQLLVLFAMRSPLALSLSTGTALTATYWGATTSTRLACILVASALSPGALLVISVALTAAATWLLSALAAQSAAALWVGAVLVAVGTASIPPSSFLWMQHHVHVSHHVAGMLVMGPAMGEMLFPPLALRIMKGVGSTGLLHLPALLSLSVIALWAAAWRLARHPCSSLCAHADPAAHTYQLASQTDEDDLLDLTMSPVTHRGNASVARRTASHANGNGVHRLNT